MADTVSQAIEQVDERAPNIALIDLTPPDNTGLALLAYLSQFPSDALQSIVISGATDLETLRLCEKLGAKGYISKVHAFTSIVPAIKAVCAQQKYFEHSMIEEFVSNSPHIRFTPRQRDIVDLLLVGYSNKKIAQTLNLSCGTVKNYIFDLMRMTSVSSRLELAIKIKGSGYERST